MPLQGNDKIKIKLVDGTVVRNQCFTDFTMGGHGYVYRFIPKDEVWIERSLPRADLLHVLLHELRERKLMKEDGMRYEAAHDRVTKLEAKERGGHTSNQDSEVYTKEAAERDFAPGLPRKRDVGDLSKIPKDKLLTYVLQQHNARRAGPHLDVRIGSPELGLYSWAVPGNNLPAPGQRSLAIQQGLHRHKYRKFEGEIPAGVYGGGTVRKVDEGQVVVGKVDPNHIRFTVAHRKYPEMFSLVRMGNGKDWLLVNRTPQESRPLQEFKKVKYAKVSPEDVGKVLQGQHAISEKLDGASVLLEILKDKVNVVSYRPSVTGKPIVHTQRIGGLEQLDIPKELRNKLLRAELVGVKKGKAIAPQELNAYLNSSLANSIVRQRREGVQLKLAPFAVIGQDKSYTDTVKDLRNIVNKMPSKAFYMPRTYTDPAKGRKLFEDTRAGRNPMTEEGIVATPLEGGVPTKVKFTDDKDVIIRNIFPAVTKSGPPRAGGFEYSLTPDGKVVGKVGSGFLHDTLQDMLARPDDYVGRTAKIKSLGQFPSGAYRAPRYLALHEDPVKTAAEISFPEEELADLRLRLSDTGKIGTTRVSSEKGRYALGDVLKSRLGELRVRSVRSGKAIEDHPYFGELTDSWKTQIGNRPFDYVELEPRKTAMEIPKPYRLPIFKTAGSRLREMVRFGRLSDSTINKLQRSKMLPSNEVVTKGIREGSANIMKQLGLVIPYDRKKVIPLQAHELLKQKPPKDLHHFFKRMRGTLMEYEKGESKLFTPKKYLKLLNDELGIDPNRVNPARLAAIIERHEVDEVRSSLSHFRRYNSVFSKRPNMDQWVMSTGHASPSVLLHEAKNLGYFPEELKHYLQYRSRDLKGLNLMVNKNKIPHQYRLPMPKIALQIELEKGDTILTGRFKNVPRKVTTIGTDELGQPTVNGRKMLSFRIQKLMPKKAAETIPTRLRTLLNKLKYRSKLSRDQAVRPTTGGEVVGQEGSLH